MSEQEKEAIEYLKGKFEFFEEDDTLAKWDYEAINTMLGLIDKLQEKIIQISEICIDESKCHISTKDAIEEIRRVI